MSSLVATERFVRHKNLKVLKEWIAEEEAVISRCDAAIASADSQWTSVADAETVANTIPSKMSQAKVDSIEVGRQAVVDTMRLVSQGLHVFCDGYKVPHRLLRPLLVIPSRRSITCLLPRGHTLPFPLSACVGPAQS
jgi:hypothetical protein